MGHRILKFGAVVFVVLVIFCGYNVVSADTTTYLPLARLSVNCPTQSTANPAVVTGPVQYNFGSTTNPAIPPPINCPGTKYLGMGDLWGTGTCNLYTWGIGQNPGMDLHKGGTFKLWTIVGIDTAIQNAVAGLTQNVQNCSWDRPIPTPTLTAVHTPTREATATPIATATDISSPTPDITATVTPTVQITTTLHRFDLGVYNYNDPSTPLPAPPLAPHWLLAHGSVDLRVPTCTYHVWANEEFDTLLYAGEVRLIIFSGEENEVLAAIVAEITALNDFLASNNQPLCVAGNVFVPPTPTPPATDTPVATVEPTATPIDTPTKEPTVEPTTEVFEYTEVFPPPTGATYTWPSNDQSEGRYWLAHGDMAANGGTSCSIVEPGTSLGDLLQFAGDHKLIRFTHPNGDVNAIADSIEMQRDKLVGQPTDGNKCQLVIPPPAATAVSQGTWHYDQLEPPALPVGPAAREVLYAEGDLTFYNFCAHRVYGPNEDFGNLWFAGTFELIRIGGSPRAINAKVAELNADCPTVREPPAGAALDFIGLWEFEGNRPELPEPAAENHEFITHGDLSQPFQGCAYHRHLTDEDLSWLQDLEGTFEMWSSKGTPRAREAGISQVVPAGCQEYDPISSICAADTTCG